ncbi:hypothetical protein Tco_0240648 [Tanacetum coccineum]
MKSSTMSWNIALMHLWKVAGALHSPNGILRYAYSRWEGRSFNSGLFSSILLALAEQRCSLNVFSKFCVSCDTKYAVSEISIRRIDISKSDRSPRPSELAFY